MRAGIVVLALALTACSSSPSPSTEQPNPYSGILLPGMTADTPCEEAVVALWKAQGLSEGGFRAEYDRVFALCTDDELQVINGKAAQGWGFNVAQGGRTYFERQECRSPGYRDTKLCQSIQ
jgi:hypothetical protein